MELGAPRQDRRLALLPCGAPRRCESARGHQSPCWGRRGSVRTMSPEELQASDPALFAAVRQLGIDAERKRVADHLTAADHNLNPTRCYSRLDMALADIVAGTEVTAQTMKKHFD